MGFRAETLNRQGNFIFFYLVYLLDFLYIIDPTINPLPNKATIGWTKAIESISGSSPTDISKNKQDAKTAIQALIFSFAYPFRIPLIVGINAIINIDCISRFEILSSDVIRQNIPTIKAKEKVNASVFDIFEKRPLDNEYIKTNNSKNVSDIPARLSHILLLVTEKYVVELIMPVKSQIAQDEGFGVDLF